MSPRFMVTNKVIQRAIDSSVVLFRFFSPFIYAVMFYDSDSECNEICVLCLHT